MSKYKYFFMAGIALALAQAACKTKEVSKFEVPWYSSDPSIIRLSKGKPELRTQVDSQCPENIKDFGDFDIIKGYASGQTKRGILDLFFDALDGKLSLLKKTTDEATVAPSKPIFICRKDPPTGSLEAVAVRAHADIKVAADWYTTVTGKHLDPVSVEVQRQTKLTIYARLTAAAYKIFAKDDSITKQGSIALESDEVDNAFWTINGQNSYVIGLMPHAIQDVATTTNNPVPLWELPLTLRHEYGHHVFYSKMRDFMGDPSIDYLKRLAVNPFLHTTIKRVLQTATIDFEGEGDKRETLSSFDVLSALNDGFSDMYSYYSSEEKFLGVEQAPCFQITRDVASPDLAGVSAKKVWTKSLLVALFDEKLPLDKSLTSKSKECNAYRVSDTHHLGAIIAYSTTQILGLAEAAKLPKEKTALALEWLETLNKNLSYSEDGPAALLSKINEYAVLTAAGKTAMTPETKLCKMVQAEYPGFEERWIKQQSPAAACFTSTSATH